MTEAEFIARAKSATCLGDFEKLIYEKSAGRTSRSDCKAIVSKLNKLVKKEQSDEAKARLPALLEASFWQQIVR